METDEARALGAGGFEEVESPQNVGGDEIARAGDGTIHMRLGREVHDVGDLMLLKNAEDSLPITKIDFFKDVFGVLVGTPKIREVARVSEAIQIDQAVDAFGLKQQVNEIGADETGTAGDQKIHGGFRMRC